MELYKVETRGGPVLMVDDDNVDFFNYALAIHYDPSNKNYPSIGDLTYPVTPSEIEDIGRKIDSRKYSKQKLTALKNHDYDVLKIAVQYFLVVRNDEIESKNASKKLDRIVLDLRDKL